MAKTNLVVYVRRSLTGFLAVAATAGAVADDAEGVVRIQSPAASQQTVIRAQSPDDVQQTGHRRQERIEARRADCPPQGYVVSDYCPEEYDTAAHRMRMCGVNHRMRNHMASEQLGAMVHDECHDKFNWVRCKFGYFFPSGMHGKGAPPIGHYSMVYPLNPSYFDARDGQVYAAPGYAGPVSVPLAPVVHHQYNYGWGVPSSRLTPISNPVLP